MILSRIPAAEDLRILDIGCGNGRMLGYLQKKTGAYICGFDYSSAAIGQARKLFTKRAEFREGIIGEIDYPDESFDAVISMDSMYFAADMTEFVGQIKRWLKPDGVFLAAYQEGDVTPKTPDLSSCLLTRALEANNMRYEAENITLQCYELLRRKRDAAIRHRQELEAEGNGSWAELLLMQCDYAQCDFAEFEKNMTRYIFAAGK